MMHRLLEFLLAPFGWLWRWHEREIQCPAGATCLDCGLPYYEFGLDLTLPDDQWLAIHPHRDGLLCATCIARRAAVLPGAIALRASLERVDPCARRHLGPYIRQHDGAVYCVTCKTFLPARRNDSTKGASHV